MNETIDKFQIVETSDSLSFKPFYHHRKKIKWYAIAILFFSGLTAYQWMNEVIFIISVTFLIITSWFFIKELLFYIPVRYTFDWSFDAVYQSNLFATKKKIMSMHEVIIYQSSEMGAWQYKMGKKKSQFIKNYAISEYFSAKNNDQKSIDYEHEILRKIEQMIPKNPSRIPTSSDGSSFTH